jgi:D-3-phosphoglycerate dehydrogenase / 2-oxoglutarate reductase
MKILITCPPMLGLKSEFIPLIESYGCEAICPNFTQTMSEDELVKILPSVDGWIIGDDPASEKVFLSGLSGNFKGAVKWGIGTDNVDLDACNRLNIPITNTPNMFGDEVSDLAIGYLIGLAREFVEIDREVRLGNWVKKRGISIRGKTVGVVGLGDIGSNVAAKLDAFGMNIIGYDPVVINEKSYINHRVWPNGIDKCDFLIFTCALNKNNKHMYSSNEINQSKKEIRIINVSRGPLIDQDALIKGLESGKIYSAALDVFEEEPLPALSFLSQHSRCILGSHNASNTIDAVRKTNIVAIEALMGFLGKAQ